MFLGIPSKKDKERRAELQKKMLDDSLTPQERNKIFMEGVKAENRAANQSTIRTGAVVASVIGAGVVASKLKKDEPAVKPAEVIKPVSKPLETVKEENMSFASDFMKAAIPSKTIVGKIMDGETSGSVMGKAAARLVQKTTQPTLVAKPEEEAAIVNQAREVRQKSSGASGFIRKYWWVVAGGILLLLGVVAVVKKRR